MVRTSTNEPSEEKKAASKKKSASRKKAVVTGIWPCKINGCNKQFAREADLKRHQRTTKVHSMPGFACPQCGATFTRTDALRRHQKSRHNGVVIEPPEQDLKADAEDGGSSQSQSKSRSATPSPIESVPTTPAVNTPYTAQNSRPSLSSYYRQHTLTSSGPYIPRPPLIDPQCPQIGLPTSATRLNSTTHWGYPHAWPESATHQMSYHQMYYSPHYRPNGAAQPPRLAYPPDPNQQHNAYTSATDTQRLSTPPCSQDSRQDTKPLQNDTCTPATESSIPTVDSSVNPSNATLTEAQVLEITQVAMKAVLEAEAERSSTESGTGSTSTATYSEKAQRCNNDAPEKSTGNNDDESHVVHGYGLPLDRPEPMEHMLTEDGEPMLNPAELLTQESLASPPPS